MMIETIFGPMNESMLVKATGCDETTDAIVSWVEYRLHHNVCASTLGGPCNCTGDGPIIHRSVLADVKATAAAFAKGDLF